MKRALLFTGFIFIFSLVFFGAQSVFAGGCCFKSFSATTGIAGKQNAEVNVSFVDPQSMFSNTGTNTTGPLSGQKIDIHILSPKSGQSCWMVSETTDSSGHTEARCSSTSSGDILVKFTAPNMDSQSQQSINYASRSVHFDADPNAPPVDPTHIPTNTPVPFVPTATNTPASHQIDDISPEETIEVSEDTEKLQKRVQELEQKVEDQQKEVSTITAMLNKLLDLFRSFFGK